MRILEKKVSSDYIERTTNYLQNFIEILVNPLPNMKPNTVLKVYHFYRQVLVLWPTSIPIVPLLKDMRVFGGLIGEGLFGDA